MPRGNADPAPEPGVRGVTGHAGRAPEGEPEIAVGIDYRTIGIEAIRGEVEEDSSLADWPAIRVKVLAPNGFPGGIREIADAPVGGETDRVGDRDAIGSVRTSPRYQR